MKKVCAEVLFTIKDVRHVMKNIRCDCVIRFNLTNQVVIFS